MNLAINLDTDTAMPATFEPVSPPLPERVRQAIDLLKAIVTDQPTSLVIAYSGGKDSTVVTSIALAALAELAQEGRLPADIEHLAVSSNTGIKNPVIERHVGRHLQAMRAFVAEAGVPLKAKWAMPSLAESWQVSVLGGRRQMAWPSEGQSQYCSVDWKIKPIDTLKRQHAKSLPKGVRQITLLGSRFEESARRAANMEDQGASTEVVEHQGRLLTYPIASWTTSDVWDFILFSQPFGKGGPFPSYTDSLADVLEVYNSANGECSIVGDSGKRTPCGARTGCWACPYAGRSDESLSNMAKDNPEMGPLLALRQYIVSLRHDASARNFVGTDIKDSGAINISAAGYSGRVLLDLLRACLTIDAEEMERSDQPAFQIITPQELVAIEWSWAIRGLQVRPWEATRAWVEVYHQGKRFPIPSASTNQPVQAGGQALHPLAGETMGSTTTPLMAAAGVTVAASARLEVDPEGAMEMLSIEGDWLAMENTKTPESVANSLLIRGVVSIPAGRRSEIDRRLTAVARLREEGVMSWAFSGGRPTLDSDDFQLEMAS
ncbi:phosphoadenosine phosphosulfate reductase domain-containing protein [Halomonas sp. AOP13-D3-9]